MIKWICLLFIFVPFINVEAFYCSNDEILEFTKRTNNIVYKYDYVDTIDSVSFTVTISNLTPGIYLYDEVNKSRYDYSSQDLVLTGYQSGQTITMQVNVAQGDCIDKNLRYIRIQLPTYNSFYKDQACVGYENHYLCDKWSTHKLTYEEFNYELEEYKKSLIIEPPPEEEIPPEDITVWDRIGEFLYNYYYIVLGAIIISAAIKIYLINKENNIYK